MLMRTAIVLIATTSAAFAAPDATREVLRQHCTGDYLAFCGDYAPDSAEVNACFKQNKAKLSSNCRAAIASYVKGQKRADAR